jgi:pectin methylesterase-like acyl-CoA thioesterase
MFLKPRGASLAPRFSPVTESAMRSSSNDIRCGCGLHRNAVVVLKKWTVTPDQAAAKAHVNRQFGETLRSSLLRGALWLCCALTWSCSSRSAGSASTGGSGAAPGQGGASAGSSGADSGGVAGAALGGATAAGASGSAGAGAGAGAAAGAAGAASKPPSQVTILSRFPAAAATVCADAPLRLTFSAPVTVGAAGKIQVFKTSAPDTSIFSIDISATVFHNVVLARQFFNVRPIFFEGNDAVIYLNNGTLKAADSYFVTIDAGVFVDATQNSLPAISGPDGWQFSTVTPAPADPTKLTVAREGGGDFCSVQGAVDFVPAGNMTPTTITIKDGTYHEIVYIPAKHNLTFHGQDRKQAIIAYPNNDTLQNKLGTSFRSTIEAEGSNGLLFQNLTVHNTTPQGGSQAEALRIEPGDQAILSDSDFISTQDTLLLSGRAYVTNSYVEGNVDYIWGKGTAYFEKSAIKTVARAGYLVQSRNSSNYGYVFIDSTFTSDGKATGTYLARIEGDRFPYSNVAYINCEFDAFLNPKGWLITNSTAATTDGLDLSHLQFWEYQSTDLAGTALDVSMRDPNSKQISADQAALLRDKATVLAGWAPTAPAEPVAN